MRSKEVINWYFINNNPRNPKIIFGYFENDSLLGYIIFAKIKCENYVRLETYDIWLDFDSTHFKKIIKVFRDIAYNYSIKNEIDLVCFYPFNIKLAIIYAELGMYTTTKIKRKEYIFGKSFSNHDDNYFSNQGDLMLH